jgi:outer membrane protein TolC
MPILIFLVFSLSFSTVVFSQKNLNLQQALKIAYKNNLEIKGLELSAKYSQQSLENIISDNGVQTSFNLNLEQKDRFETSINNSVGYVLFEKSLYNQDYNINKKFSKSALDLNLKKLNLLKQKLKTDVLQKMFNVVLSEMDNQYATENLAVFAVKRNHTEDDFNAGKVSDVEMLQANTGSDLAFKLLREKQANMQLSVAELSQLLGLKYNEIDSVKLPEIEKSLTKKLPELEDLLKNIDNNPELQLLQFELKNLEEQITAENNNYNINLDLYSKVYKYAFDTDKNGNWLVGLELSVPIGANDNKTSLLKIKKQQQSNKILQLKQNIITKVLNLQLQLKTLKQYQKALNTQIEYRDFYLEKARANYEMELKSDIGDSMAQYTKTEYLIAKNNFDIVILWQKLALLLGENYEI